MFRRVSSKRIFLVLSAIVVTVTLLMVLHQQGNIVSSSSLHPDEGFISTYLHRSPYQNNKEISNNSLREEESITESIPTLYIITPTYPRAEQLPELTRLCQTLSLVKNLVFILAEDAEIPTQTILDYLEESGLRYVYLRAQMPRKYRKLDKLKSKPRGVANRNAGIEWIRTNAKEGVFFFADDDNSYDIRIFEEIRSTKVVSMFPVGLVAQLGVSTPIVRDGKIVGFYDGWIAKRKFPVDMAGFAINVNMLFKFPNAWMPFVVGYEEDGFMKSLNITYKDIELKAHNCTKIWVWHTQTKKTILTMRPPKKFTLSGTNLEAVYSKVWIDESKTLLSANKLNQILDLSKSKT